MVKMRTYIETVSDSINHLMKKIKNVSILEKMLEMDKELFQKIF